MSTIYKIGFLYCAMLICAGSASAQGWPDTCAHLKDWEADRPASQFEAKQKYDTLKLYIKMCAATDKDSYTAFAPLDGAVGLYAPNDASRFDEYRHWLISVLYLNTTEPAYFCNCLASIAGTYQYGKYYPLGYLTVLDYLRHTPSCYGKGLDREFSKDSLTAFQDGYDPTHLPPLDSLELGFLLKSDVKSHSSQFLSERMASLSSTPNPFTKVTTLQFTLNRTIYTTIEVYDELGRLVWGDGKGSSLEAGTHSITIDGKNLPHGTLYARISTRFGEVKTVKLVHE
ncbi:MAG: T9SS type A sorting domain-containing protein [Bacteroidota bacterium]|nr:T9SS type A sorting domain-containing protein [Bacteroidota bacterium]MDP4228769.1 T9SS type A sorting domain-containing protein [Bacteroidota bacterium]MDP4236034.1 T9SS type A sorting domain-containing protein [Bacteroidota bacterium]